MKDTLRTHVDAAFEMTGIEPAVRCEALDSILGPIVNALFKRNREVSDFGNDLMEFGKDCNSGSLCYIRMPI